MRAEVAVGTVREASMFSTRRMAPPRMGCRTSPGRIDVRATAAVRLGAAAAGAMIGLRDIYEGPPKEDDIVIEGGDFNYCCCGVPLSGV